MSQAEERAKVAEEKACAAVTAIGMVKTPEQKKAKLNNRDAEKFWSETYTADRVDKKSSAEFLGKCASTRLVGETSAGVGCRLPRPVDRDDMIRDKREARAAIKLSGGGNQPPPDVDQLKLREMKSDFAEEASEGGSDTSSVQKLAESLSVIVETLQLCFERQEQRKR